LSVDMLSLSLGCWACRNAAIPKDIVVTIHQIRLKFKPSKT
jgi:hypothetical protein